MGFILYAATSNETQPRFVVFGTGSPMKSRSESVADNSGRSSAARKGLKDNSARPSLIDVSQLEAEQEGLFVTIYKAKVRKDVSAGTDQLLNNYLQGDKESISQHNLSAFKSCEVRALMHRKGGHTLPTLLLEFKPETSSEKARKRRSSRTSGLTTKDPWSNILLFRTVPDDHHNIYDWQQVIKPYLRPEGPTDSIITPGPYFHNFSNPFSSRENSVRRSDVMTRGSERNMSSYPHAPRERPTIISPSPSLRSRRSDVSSQASSQHPTLGFVNGHPQTFITTLPNDLPSPASTSYEPQFIEGWTTAQGRSSALSQHTRGSNSIASAAAPSSVSQFASTPPGPRETILDRAFQMKMIPGSERIPEQDEDRLTSLARFEALMQEEDEKNLESARTSDTKDISEWNPDDDSEDDSGSGEPDLNHDSSDEVDDIELSDGDDVGIPSQAQVAIEYISGRRTPIPSKRTLSPAPATPPVPFVNNQAMSAFHGSRYRSPSPLGLRPRTGTNPTPPPNHFSDNHFNRFVPTRSHSSTMINVKPKQEPRPELPQRAETLSAESVASTEKRASRDSAKRLSFQEFTRRLSSTSSLLLVQSNVSGSGTSVRTSYEDDASDQKHAERPGMKSRNCSWRGSVGAFGNEGGFL